MNRRNENPIKKGDLAEKLFELECVNRDIPIFAPVNSASRVDYIVQLEGEFKKVQIKYISAIRNESICVSFVKHQNGRKDKETDGRLYKKYTSDEIDLFMVYCPDTKEWYNIPNTLMNESRGVVLRLTAPKNNQMKGVRFAKEFVW